MQALLFGLSLTIMAELYLALCAGALATLLGLAVIVGYLFLYTRLKTRTPLLHDHRRDSWRHPATHWLGGSTWTIGRRGMGAVCDHVSVAVHTLLCIARLHREDSKRAGIRMLPVVETDGRRTARYIVWAPCYPYRLACYPHC